MKHFSLIFAICLSLLFTGCVTTDSGNQASTTVISTPTVVTAACGTCKLGLDGKSCDLAVKIEGKSYFVSGYKLEQFGEAHAADGMCNVERQAKVTGKVVKGKFVASSFELLPNK